MLQPLPAERVTRKVTTVRTRAGAGAVRWKDDGDDV